MDDGVRHLPSMNPYRKPKHRHRQWTGPFGSYQTPYYEASGDGYDLIYPDVYEDRHHQRIGKIVFPDVVELEGSGAGELYSKYGKKILIFGEPFWYGGDESDPLWTTSPARKITHLLFGYPQGPDEPPEDILRYTPKPKHLLIRCVLLILSAPQFMYLEAPPTNCYCDETCVALGDCCSDYTYVCPPQDCEVSDWYPWEGCVADVGECGTGVEQRVRYVTHRAERGGASCPPLKEMRTCFKQCTKRRSLDDITTVALLVDYRYNETRNKTSRDNIYWDLPWIQEKLSQATNYCVQYKIGWVNRNCCSSLFFRENTICAECQPMATLHRNNGRCASDLEDGEQGFWKLVGPKSCNGVWTRISRTDNCHCSRDLPHLDPFLLV
ncbi:unnamed protein product [Heligmosomoides polygyrus]|uniref:SMB domain-containing protein n=1 Tax=Heligmosomoides polygyrus TaxID=6339 RepID=A0A3P8DI19_HELPZ|nr:unnamed protein product [Heligmosomoides polygyrus]